MTEPLSKVCPMCGRTFSQPATGGMAKWMRKATCGRPACVTLIKKQNHQRAMGSR